MKEVKSRLNASFKEVQRFIKAGTIPDNQTIQDFVSHSRAFAALARPEWQGLMGEYLALMEKLQQAAASNQTTAVQEAVQALTDRMVVCHREFKK